MTETTELYSVKGATKSPNQLHAVIDSHSKYFSQCDGTPFLVRYEYSFDGFHWRGNNNRYSDLDLIRLVPIGLINLMYGDLTPDQLKSYGETQWYEPQKHQHNRRSVDDGGFLYVNSEGLMLFRHVNNARQVPCTHCSADMWARYQSTDNNEEPGMVGDCDSCNQRSRWPFLTPTDIDNAITRIKETRT